MNCTNDARVKAAEVADGMRRFGDFEGMQELYTRGVFRHIDDADELPIVDDIDDEEAAPPAA